jgi:hypothetical protein
VVGLEVAIVDAVLKLSVEYLDCWERKADGRSGREPFVGIVLLHVDDS